MYGTIRKSYSVSRASRNSDNSAVKDLVEKNKKSKQKNFGTEDLQQTRYIKINETKKINKKTDGFSENLKKKDGTGKNEFPIASVILTIVFTMMIMVFAFGLGGI